MSTNTAANTSTSPDQLLTVTQLARLLAVHASTVRRWITNGKLPAYRVDEKGIRLRWSDVISVIQFADNGQANGERMDTIERPHIARLSAEEQRQAQAAVAGARDLQAAYLVADFRQRHTM